jgi:hypothetical protein
MLLSFQKGGEVMTVTDCKVIFNLQEQILDAPELSSDRKVEMIKQCIKNILGDKSEENK